MHPFLALLLNSFVSLPSWPTRNYTLFMRKVSVLDKRYSDSKFNGPACIPSDNVSTVRDGPLMIRLLSFFFLANLLMIFFSSSLFS